MISNVLLATYNFYPYHWGGSEIYVAGLANYLSVQHTQVRLIAAVPELAFEDYGIWWSGEQLKVCRYEYEGIIVYGVLHDLNTTDIYRKYQSIWESDWYDFFTAVQLQENWTPDLLHLHGFTAIIGLALVQAFHQQFEQATIRASYHTPISCPKGTLLRWEKEECGICTNTFDCSACTWQAKTKWPLWAAYLAIGLLPKQQFIKAPTVIQWKALINSSISSFRNLLRLVDKWWVFSEQIQQVLITQGVAPAKITLGRHAVSALFKEIGTKERGSNPLVFAFVGRFTAIKGIITLLHAWQLLPVSSERELWLIGDNNDADPAINALLAKITQRKDIIKLGKKTPAELAEIYSTIHALIVPSEWVEIGPIVVHEALACGANVIGSDIGGIKELSKHYPSGAIQLFPAGDITALREIVMAYRFKPYSCVVSTQAEHYQKVQNWYFEQA